jgi:uncharacterized protein YhfF
MIFQHTHELVMAGRKTATRRVFAHDTIVLDAYGFAMLRRTFDDAAAELEPRHPVLDVGTVGRGLKWRVGNTYAVQPGRGKRAIGRIRVTGLRVERLQTLTHEDALAEGVASVEEYAALWDAIHSKRGERWDDDPLVIVIQFELMKG